MDKKQVLEIYNRNCTEEDYFKRNVTFAFSKTQLEEAMEKLGAKDKSQLVTIFGYGDVCLKSKAKEIYFWFINREKEKNVIFMIDKKVEQEKIDTILKCAMAAPSGMNKQPWELLVVTDKEKLEKIAEIAPNAAYSKNSQVAIIVCGDKNISEKFWEQDCCAVTENILLAVEALELGAVWCMVYPSEERIDGIKSLFNLF